MGLDVVFTVWVKNIKAEVTFFDIDIPRDRALINDILPAVIQGFIQKIDFNPQYDSAGWAIKWIKRDGVPYRPEFII